MFLSSDEWWALGAVLALIITGGAFRVGTLTQGGAVAAWIVGTVVFGAGHSMGAGALLTFFGTSSALSRWRKRGKDALGWEKTGRRDGGQVWANGGVATLCLLLPFVVPSVPTERAQGLFLAALAAANADTWATEIGAALGGAPRLVTTGKCVPRGTSGAVSAEGLAAALAGAALIGVFALPNGARAALVVIGAGFVGALCDSVLGATVQAQWRDASGRLTERPQFGQAPARGRQFIGNDVVNALCTLAAVGLAGALRI